MKITVKAYAKLNLYLDITGTAPNGYHYLDNITQAVDIADIVTVSVSKGDFSCNIICDNPLIPCDESNTAYKAAKAFVQEALSYMNENLSISVDIEKNTPIMGGMGGSSVDAAGVLFALNKLFGDIFDTEKLCEIGYKVGADVPICLKGGTLISKGLGEKSESISAYDSDAYFLCVQPDFKLNTKDAYRLYDDKGYPAYNKCEEFSACLKSKGIACCGEYCYNIFTRLYGNEQICSFKEQILKLGAVYSEMTGSGSVIFGVFSDKDKALGAERYFKDKGYNSFCCKAVNNGISVLQ